MVRSERLPLSPRLVTVPTVTPTLSFGGHYPDGAKRTSHASIVALVAPDTFCSINFRPDAHCDGVERTCIDTVERAVVVVPCFAEISVYDGQAQSNLVSFNWSQRPRRAGLDAFKAHLLPPLAPRILFPGLPSLGAGILKPSEDNAVSLQLGCTSIPETVGQIGRPKRPDWADIHACTTPNASP